MNTLDMEMLRLMSRQIALEGLSQESFISDMVSKVKNIFNSFRAAPNIVDDIKGFSRDPAKDPLSKESKEFLKTINAHSYIDLMKLRATVPEGMNCTYLEILTPLQEASVYLKGIQSHVVQPYSVYLASFVSTKNTSLSTESKAYEYQQLEAQRDARLATFSKLYNSDSHNVDSTVGRVISRNADWEPVLRLRNEVIKNLESVNRDNLKKEVNNAVMYLGLILDNMKKNPSDTSPEAAQRLSLGAYQIAKELEFFSITYFRALTVSAAIDSTMEHIKSVYG